MEGGDDGGGEGCEGRDGISVRCVGEFVVEPSLTLGAATGSTEFPGEPFLESLGTRGADQMDEGVAEAAIGGVAKFRGGTGPVGPLTGRGRRDSVRGGFDDDLRAAKSTSVVSRQKNGVH